MPWLNLTMPNQTVKNALKAKKIKLPQMIFFSWKTTNKIFMYLLALFILQNFQKKFLELIQIYEDVPFSGPKCPICPEQNFFGTSHYYYFYLPIGPFRCARFKKYIYSGSRVIRMRNFWAQNGPSPQMRLFFFKKPVNGP